ncbi:MAG: phosphate-starvation-inducible PsiE family protein [Actinomycetota bacterium]|nr:phosphate-starvation-inducible PsiE family protein [Actinomycetota bacterium]
MSGDSVNASGGSGERPLLATILDYAQTVVYYGVTLVLLVAIGVLFVSVGTTLLAVFEVDPLETTLAVLDRVLLITIFVELLVTIEVLVQERKIVAEPFLLIGLLAVIRRILLVTAELGQTVSDPERFLNLVTELGVLTALVISLAAALYIARRTQRQQEEA